MTFDDVICHFRVFVPPEVIWCADYFEFGIRLPFMCRNWVIGVIKYTKEKLQFLRKIILCILTPKRVRRGPKGIAYYF